MKRNDFIRFALMLSNSQATTFKKNLTKIIKLVLFESYGESLTLDEIAKRAKEMYSLEFADAEINEAIRSDRLNVFIQTRSSNDPVYNRYTITPEEYDKLKETGESDHFESIVKRFVSEFKSQFTYSTEVIKSLIYRYIYIVFNSDIKTVLSLMNYNDAKLIEDIPYDNFSNDERTLINTFLNWDDREKNQFIFNIVSSCYEYCMMTVKKDKSSFASIFHGKEFYLDANIIFRLAGFNNNERQEVVEAFLRKCKECGITIKYTNITNVEINNTLEYQVERLKKILNGQYPIRIEAAKQLSSKYANLDFYSKYVEWTKQPGNKVKDYSAFLQFLKRKVINYLKQMKFEAFESYESKAHTDFIRLCDEFKSYKDRRLRDTYEGSIKVDIENYLYMQKLNSAIKTNSIVDKKHFFITADHCHVDWAKEKTPGAVPTFVLPSVWYSLMLKYKGRTDNDYTAFCQFLNFRISTPQDNLADTKEQMLAYILGIDESAEIKEEIIFDIDRRLAHETAEITDIEAYVKESHVRITEGKVQDAIKQTEQRHVIEKVEIIESALQAAKQQHDDGYDKGKNEGFADGEKSGVEKVIKVEINRKIKRNRRVRVGGILAGILLILFALIVLIFGKIQGVSDLMTYLNANSAIITIVPIGLSAIAFLISQLNKYVDVLSIKEEVVEHNIRKRYDIINNGTSNSL